MQHCHHNACKSSQLLFLSSDVVQGLPCALFSSGVFIGFSFEWKKSYKPWFSSTAIWVRFDASVTGTGSASLETERGWRGPVLRTEETPLSRFMSLGYADGDEVEKAVPDLRREGARDGVEMCCGGACGRGGGDGGRISVDGDMVMGKVGVRGRE